jgi:murein DD-endopeptidase MepM/ murein hydrolase activator NlpD
MNREGVRFGAGAQAGGTASEGVSPWDPGTEVPDRQDSNWWWGQELDQFLDRSVSSAQASADHLAVLGQVLERRQEALLSLPQCLPINGRLTSGFGYRRSPFGRRLEFHEGVDLAAPRGTPVRAVADGVVVFAGYKPGLGRTVVVDHGHGVQTVYGHHSRLMVSAGQRVRAAEVIAAVGDSGRSTGDHLHFELRFNGRAVDPWPYLKRLGGGN